MRQISHIIVHCSADGPNSKKGAAEIRAFHMATPPNGRGWADIGYHYVIRRDGLIEAGRSEETVGAHAAPWNTRSIGVCLVGGVAVDGKTPEANFTDDQWKSLAAIVDRLCAKYPQAEVIGHRDVPGVKKDCPCFDVREWRSKARTI